jgi:hypothetical protein
LVYLAASEVSVVTVRMPSKTWTADVNDVNVGNPFPGVGYRAAFEEQQKDTTFP